MYGSAPRPKEAPLPGTARRTAEEVPARIAGMPGEGRLPAGPAAIGAGAGCCGEGRSGIALVPQRPDGGTGLTIEHGAGQADSEEDG